MQDYIKQIITQLKNTDLRLYMIIYIYIYILALIFNIKTY